MAPREGKVPISLVNDKFYEKHTHSHILPTGNSCVKVNCSRQSISLMSTMKFKNDVLEMVKKLDIATYFSTLSCTDLCWEELISTLNKIYGLNIHIHISIYRYLKC